MSVLVDRYWVDENGYALYSHQGGPALLDWEKSTLDEGLSYRASVSPDIKQFMILGDGETITDEMTWGEAHERAMRVAGLLSRFVPERSKILLCFENGLEAILAYFGCAYANMIPVSGIYPTAAGSGERLFDILEDSGAVAVLGLRQTLMDFRRIGKEQAADVKWIPIEGAEKADGLYKRHGVGVDEVALIQYTSGSVGRPRGVQISHRNLGYNLHLLLDRTGVRPGVRGISWLPLSHDMGLMTGLFLGVVAGGPCLLMSPQHFIEKPERWFLAVHRYRLGFSAGPNFAYDLCTRLISDDVLEGLDLSCWQRSVIGAEMIEKSTIDRFLERFGPLGIKKSFFRPGYGLAESTLLIASGDKAASACVEFSSYSRMHLAEGKALPPLDKHDERILASSGFVVEAHEIVVVDPETTEILRSCEVGELWLSGPSISCGYLNREDENRERFGLIPEGYKGNSKGFFCSRDMGFFDEKGRLYITGRMEHRLFIEGRSFDPDDFAALIRAETSLFEGRALAIFMYKEMLHIAGEVPNSLPREQREPLMRSIARLIARHCALKKVKVILVRVGGIPRTPSGKIRLLKMKEILDMSAMALLAERSFGEDELSMVEILGEMGKAF